VSDPTDPFHPAGGDLDAVGRPLRRRSQELVARVEVDPGAVELLSGRAEIHFREGRRQEARAELLEVLEIEPDRARAHYMLGLIYAQDDTAKAREHFERFIALAPEAPEVATAKQLLATF
jgi:Flp pilus assembly protein TadD